MYLWLLYMLYTDLLYISDSINAGTGGEGWLNGNRRHRGRSVGGDLLVFLLEAVASENSENSVLYTFLFDHAGMAAVGRRSMIVDRALHLVPLPADLFLLFCNMCMCGNNGI